MNSVKKADICIIHSPAYTPTIHVESSVYVPKGVVYLSPDNDVVKWARNIHRAEKEVNEWIRKYENVLNGLNYWKERALNEN